MWRNLRWLKILALAATVGLTTAAAPAPEPPLSSPADAVVLAWKDAQTLPADDAPFIRYLWVATPGAKATAVWRLHQNLLSRYSEMTEPVEITPWLWRIDLREPQWEPATWEKSATAENEVYFHQTVTLAEDAVFAKVRPIGLRTKGTFSKGRKPGRFLQSKKAGAKVQLAAAWLPGETVVKLRELLYTESPVLNAEWLFVQSARQRNLLNDDNHGLGYYDFLRLKDRRDYFELIDPKSNFVRASELFGREFLAALDKSAISPQNRQFFRYQSRGGGTWSTLDTDKQKGRGVALKNLRRPDSGAKDQTGRFKHNTEEWYGPMSNGLPAVFLSDDKGVRQNVAPGDTHGLHDRSSLNESNSQTLHIGLSCWQCHYPNVLKPFTDDVRKQYALGQLTFLGAKDKKQGLEFRQLLMSDIYTAFADDQALYVRAFAKATVTRDHPKGLDVKTAVKWYSRWFHAYATDDVTLASSARWLGVTEALWLRALRNYARPLPNAAILSDEALGRFLLKEPLGMTRLTFEDSYSLAQVVLAQERARMTKAKDKP